MKRKSSKTVALEPSSDELLVELEANYPSGIDVVFDPEDADDEEDGFEFEAEFDMDEE